MDYLKTSRFSYVFNVDVMSHIYVTHCKFKLRLVRMEGFRKKTKENKIILNQSLVWMDGKHERKIKHWNKIVVREESSVTLSSH